MSVCKNCAHSNANTSPELRESLNFCLAFQGWDGCHTWGTPVWANMEDDILNAVLDGHTSSPGREEDCSAFSPTPDRKRYINTPTHRVKVSNSAKILTELERRGIPAEQVAAPHSEQASYDLLPLLGDPAFDDGWVSAALTADIKGMVGIRADISGKLFHKLLIEVGI